MSSEILGEGGISIFPLLRCKYNESRLFRIELHAPRTDGAAKREIGHVEVTLSLNRIHSKHHVQHHHHHEGHVFQVDEDESESILSTSTTTTAVNLHHLQERFNVEPVVLMHKRKGLMAKHAPVVDTKSGMYFDPITGKPFKQFHLKRPIFKRK